MLLNFVKHKFKNKLVHTKTNKKEKKRNIYSVHISTRNIFTHILKDQIDFLNFAESEFEK